MKVFVRLAIGAVLVLGALSARSMAYSYAYDPWTGMTGAGVIAINPFLYAPSFNPFISGGDWVAAYGVSSNVDVMVDFAGLSYSPAFTYNYSWGMVRYDFGGNNIIALQASQYAITPQYHLFMENDGWAFEGNLYSAFTYSNVNTPVIGAYIAPVWKAFKDTCYFYLEVDPSLTLGTGFSLNLVPGVWFGLGQVGQLSIGVTLANVTGAITPGVAAWYFLTFDTTKK